MSIATDSIQKQYIGLDIDKFPLPSISVQFMATSPTGMLKYWARNSMSTSKALET